MAAPACSLLRYLRWVKRGFVFPFPRQRLCKQQLAGKATSPALNSSGRRLQVKHSRMGSSETGPRGGFSQLRSARAGQQESLAPLRACGEPLLYLCFGGWNLCPPKSHFSCQVSSTVLLEKGKGKGKVCRGRCFTASSPARRRFLALSHGDRTQRPQWRLSAAGQGPDSAALCISAGETPPWLIEPPLPAGDTSPTLAPSLCLHTGSSLSY